MKANLINTTHSTFGFAVRLAAAVIASAGSVPAQSDWMITQTMQITHPQGGFYDVLGRSASVSGNLLAAGAPNRAGSAGPYSGAVIIFDAAAGAAPATPAPLSARGTAP